jgi:RNA polymerase sigma-70 factor (ECF subfamily)
MTDSDASLVERTLAGDMAAADVLLRRHFRTCYLVALSAVGDRAEADDVCQEAFIRALAKLHECRAPERFAAWLAAIVRNVGHNRRRYLHLRRTDAITDHGELTTRTPTDETTQRRELRSHLLGALSQLPRAQREVVLLHDLDGLRHREIAARLGLSEAMSRRHLSDARARLRELLGDYATVSPDHD